MAGKSTTDMLGIEVMLYRVKLPRKTSSVNHLKPVPQTDTGGRDENLKTREITLVKELGKLTP